MDDRRQPLLRVIQSIEDAPHAREIEVDDLGMQRKQPRQDCIA
jgi:hypothetical protein